MGKTNVDIGNNNANYPPAPYWFYKDTVDRYKKTIEDTVDRYKKIIEVLEKERDELKERYLNLRIELAKLRGQEEAKSRLRGYDVTESGCKIVHPVFRR